MKSSKMYLLTRAVTACPAKIIDILFGYCRKGTMKQDLSHTFRDEETGKKKLIFIKLRFSFGHVWSLAHSCLIVGTLCLIGVNNQSGYAVFKYFCEENMHILPLSSD